MIKRNRDRYFLAVILLLAILIPLVCSYDKPEKEGRDIGFYTTPTKALPLPLLAGKEAKNIILLIGDGMGVAQVDTARIKGPRGGGVFIHGEDARGGPCQDAFREPPGDRFRGRGLRYGYRLQDL